MVKLCFKSCVFVICALSFYNKLCKTEPCNIEEFYHHAFSKCCDNITCNPGTFYNCTKCIPCPNGTYQSKSLQKTSCQPHATCSEHEVAIQQGNTTHDTVCGVLSTAPTTSLRIITETDQNDNTTIPVPANSNSQLEWGIIIAVIFFIVILAVVGVILWKCGDKIFSCCKTSPTNDNPLEVRPMIENEIDRAKERIKGNLVKLRKDIDSSGGLFWAALKEGEHAFTYDDEQKCFKAKNSTDRNKMILDTASKGSHKIKSLIYALVVTDQIDLAKIISETLTEEQPRNKDWVAGNDYKEKLVNNRVYILKNLDVDSEFWAHLRENDVFKEEDEENSEKMSKHGSLDYIIELMLKDPKKFENFMKALHANHRFLWDMFSEDIQPHNTVVT